MSKFPSTTVKITAVEPQGDKVRVTMELLVDVHRLTEVGGEMLRAAVGQMKTKKKQVSA